MGHVAIGCHIWRGAADGAIGGVVIGTGVVAVAVGIVGMTVRIAGTRHLLLGLLFDLNGRRGGGRGRGRGRRRRR